MRLPLTTIPIEFKYAQSPAAMYLTPTNDLTSIFVDGKLKPGTYKIQNLASKTYLEVLEHSNELCCRPDSVLTPDDAAVNWNELLAFERLTYLVFRSGISKPRGRDTV